MLSSVLRSARVQQQSHFAYSLPNHIARNAPSAVRFAETAYGPKQPNEMDSQKQSKPESKTLDAMSSFGEGYATRSDEEGFGCIYGRNQSLHKDDDEEKNIHGDDAEFDHNQGSEVKETEKARHQNKVAT